MYRFLCLPLLLLLTACGPSREELEAAWENREALCVQQRESGVLETEVAYVSCVNDAVAWFYTTTEKASWNKEPAFQPDNLNTYFNERVKVAKDLDAKKIKPATAEKRYDEALKGLGTRHATFLIRWRKERDRAVQVSRLRSMYESECILDYQLKMPKSYTTHCETGTHPQKEGSTATSSFQHCTTSEVPAVVPYHVTNACWSAANIQAQSLVPPID